MLPGAVAFELYDTYGFPLDLQEVIGREQGFEVDMAGFEQELERARERSPGSKVGEAAVDAVYKELAQALPASEFLGYERESARSKRAGDRARRRARASSSTRGRGRRDHHRADAVVRRVRRPGRRSRARSAPAARASRSRTPCARAKAWSCTAASSWAAAISVGDEVELEVDRALRAATRRNHSATHLLHLGLRRWSARTRCRRARCVGPIACASTYSAGQPLTPEQIAQIEDMVNERVLQNAEVTTHVLPMAEAKQRGAIGIFEEKYGEVVRMLTIADSIELCGGTHVRRTGDIGAFKILSRHRHRRGRAPHRGRDRHERAALHARARARDDRGARRCSRRSPRELTDKVERLLEQRKEQAREIEQWKRKLVSGGSRDLAAEAQEAGRHVRARRDGRRRRRRRRCARWPTSCATSSRRQ